ncbi:MAG: Methyltransferase type 11 [Betaproteobacteria bacterium]|nr:Methyltransferase type 11 [Betaproteobacteria bacterium]
MKSLWRSLLHGLGGVAAQPVVAAHQQGTIPDDVFVRRPLITHQTPSGLFCLPADTDGDHLARAIAAGKPLAAELMTAVQRYVVPGTVIFEVGAGFGQVTAVLSGLAEPAGQVIAFEADEYRCEVLQQTIRLNHCENVRVFFGACHGGQRDDMDAASKAPSRGIDALDIQSAVSLLYVAAGGFELEVLRGAAATLGRWRAPVIFRLQPALVAAFPSTALSELIASLGYAITERHAAGVCVALPHGFGPAAAAKGERAQPALSLPTPPDMAGLCKLLRSRDEIDACTQYLKQSGYVQHNLSCKNWDLAHVLPAITDGNFLDMGSSDSFVLKNVALKRIRGELHGIDLRAPDVPITGVHYAVGDLMQTTLPDGHFAHITCLSVLEHEVDYDRFAAEAARLLAPGGRLFVTFDYWEPKVAPSIKLYDLAWQPLDAAMVRRLFASCKRHGLATIQEFDFTTGEPVIEWGYFSPHPDVRYTFGISAFEKR